MMCKNEVCDIKGCGQQRYVIFMLGKWKVWYKWCILYSSEIKMKVVYICDRYNEVLVN